MNFLSASVKIDVDDKNLPAQLAKTKAVVTGTVAKMRAAVGGMVTKFRSAFAKIARYAKIAAVAIAAVGLAAVKLAMNAEESENLFEVSMGRMADATRKWSEELSKALYLNQYEVRRNVSTFNVMFTSMGLNAEAAAEMSKGLTKLAYDMASFYNLRPVEAFQKLQAGITGEAEPLKRLGILVNETTIKQYALNNAIGDGTGKLTEIEKVQARYGSILEQTTKAQGDLARTLNSSTNVFRAIWTQIKLTGTVLGTQLIPKITETGIAIRDWLVENQQAVVDVFVATVSAVGKVIKIYTEFIGAIKDIDSALTDYYKNREREKPKASGVGAFGGFGAAAGGGMPSAAGSKVIEDALPVGRLEISPWAHQQMSKMRNFQLQQEIDAAAETAEDLKEITSQSSEAIVDVHQEMVDEMIEADWGYKNHWERYWQDLQRIAIVPLEVLGDYAGRIASQSESHLSNALNDYFTRAKSWKDAMKNLWQDVLRSFIKMCTDMAAQAIMFATLKSALGIGSWFAGGGMPTVGTVTPEAGATLAKYQHGGVVKETGPAYVHKGEVITPAGGGNIEITIHNEGREKLEVSSAESYMYSDRRILDVVMKGKETDGTFRRSMRRG